jgi:hypothetical protein
MTAVVKGYADTPQAAFWEQVVGQGTCTQFCPLVFTAHFLSGITLISTEECSTVSVSVAEARAFLAPKEEPAAAAQGPTAGNWPHLNCWMSNGPAVCRRPRRRSL